MDQGVKGFVYFNQLNEPLLLNQEETWFESRSRLNFFWISFRNCLKVMLHGTIFNITLLP